MKKLLQLTTVLLISFPGFSQDEAMFMSAQANVKVGYAPWSSFGDFRKEYNTVNDSSVKRPMGSLSDQYGFSLGIDFFIQNHYYTAIGLTKSYSKASAKFDNGAKRVMFSDINEISVLLGWLQPTEKGHWTLTTGFNFAFGTVRSYPVFADGTRYVHTGGLSGEFHDVAIGLPLKFEVSRRLSPKFDFRIGAQANYYFEVLNLGMQNAFVTQTAGSIALNDKTLLFDVHNLSITAGISYKLFAQ